MNESRSVACPHCSTPLNAGDLLSQLARGTFRHCTPEHKAKLRANLVKAREARAAKRGAMLKQVAAWEASVKANPPKRVTDFR